MMHSKSAIRYAGLLSVIPAEPPPAAFVGAVYLACVFSRWNFFGAWYAIPWFNRFPFAVRVRARDNYRRFGHSAKARRRTNC